MIIQPIHCTSKDIFGNIKHGLKLEAFHIIFLMEVCDCTDTSISNMLHFEQHQHLFGCASQTFWFTLPLSLTCEQ